MEHAIALQLRDLHRTCPISGEKISRYLFGVISDFKEHNGQYSRQTCTFPLVRIQGLSVSRVSGRKSIKDGFDDRPGQAVRPFALDLGH